MIGTTIKIIGVGSENEGLTTDGRLIWASGKDVKHLDGRIYFHIGVNTIFGYVDFCSDTGESWSDRRFVSRIAEEDLNKIREYAEGNKE